MHLTILSIVPPAVSIIDFILSKVLLVSSSIVPKIKVELLKSTAACPLTNKNSPDCTPSEYAPVINSGDFSGGKVRKRFNRCNIGQQAVDPRHIRFFMR